MAKAPRRRAVNRYAQANQPDATLDFHQRPGLTSKDVHHCVLEFVRAQLAKGARRLRIVTGKGLHSAGDPLVRPQVERSLRRLEKEGAVRHWVSEPLDAGGQGALRVDLEP